MRALKQLIRSSVAAALFYTGLLHLYARVVLRGKIVVLTYHRVLPPEALRRSFSARSIVVTPATFAMHMECVRRWLQPLSEAEFVAHSQAGATPPPRSCMITFDDGWHDNHTQALPILQRFRVPMTLFVATDYVDTDRCFWQERLASLLFAARNIEQARPLLSQLGATDLATLDDEQARQAALQIVARAKSEQADTDALIARIEALIPDRQTAAAGEDRFMSLDQLQELDRSGLVSIGSHAMSHVRLHSQTDQRIADELLGSRDAIARWLGRAPTTFAYPNGDYDERVISAARGAGYRASFTTDRGHFQPGDDPHRIKRINMHDVAAPTKPLFMMRILGLI